MRIPDLDTVRRLCLALPEVTERLSHDAPAFFVRGKKCFVMNLHALHLGGRPGFWCAAPFGAQQALTQSRPEAFFVPPYVGHRGWLGVCLDKGLEEAELSAILLDAYRCVAPKRLLEKLDGAEGPKQ